VTQPLCRTLAGNPLTTLVVVQVNHRRELSGPACTALVRLREAGLTLLNQSVLLRGVNDDAETLAELSESLLECGVLPYYLHLLDPVSGAAHFEVRLGAALALMNSLRGMLPGYLVPRLVRETAGGAFKEPLL
jgi:L-lysine 2,3-aminomutase